MAFRVEITGEAERDGKGILEWLSGEHAGETGLQWFQGLEKAIASLATFPLRCPIAPENAEFPFEVRHLLYGRRPHVYRVVFMVESETVYILQRGFPLLQPNKPGFVLAFQMGMETTPSMVRLAARQSMAGFAKHVRPSLIPRMACRQGTPMFSVPSLPCPERTRCQLPSREDRSVRHT